MPSVPRPSWFNWPSDWPEPLEGAWESRAPIPLRGATGPFLRLYKEVTDMIQKHALAHNWSWEEGVLINYLIAGFFREYLQWRNKTGTQEYLELFAYSMSYDALCLVGHAYLHIAYDLPRVIMESLERVPLQLPISRAQMISRFLELQDGLRGVLQSAGKNPEIMGNLAYAIRLTPWRSHFLDVFGNWVLVLRSNAFLQAETFVQDPNRGLWEANLLAKIQAAAKEVIKKHRRNPVCWLSGLKTLGIVMPLPLAFLFQDDVTVQVISWWKTLAWIVLGFGALFGCYLTVVSAGAAALTEDLGRTVQRKMLNPELSYFRDRQR